MIFAQLVLCYKKFPPTFFELFSNFEKNCDFFIFERFLGHFSGNSMESGLPKVSPLLFICKLHGISFLE